MATPEDSKYVEPKYKGMTHFFAAFRYSMAGFKVAIREAAIRQELFLGVVHFVMLCVLPLSFPCRLYMTGIWFVLLACELLNTALEAVVDLASPEWHELAKRAKDLGSSTVFVMLSLLGVSWVLVALHLLGIL